MTARTVHAAAPPPERDTERKEIEIEASKVNTTNITTIKVGEYALPGTPDFWFALTKAKLMAKVLLDCLWLEEAK